MRRIVSLDRTTANDGLERSDEFDAFYRSEFVRTVRLARLLTGNADVAEDLAHEAFLRVHRVASSIDNPAAYLHTVTVNVCRNWHRSTSRESSRMERLVQPTEVQAFETDDMAEVIARLPYRQRAVLVLRYWLDLSEADIAERLGCRAGTVKSLHSRALTRIRSEIST